MNLFSCAEFFVRSRFNVLFRGLGNFLLLIWQLRWCFFFFFSSRRRHTRSDRDWSSDVCSSDLEEEGVCRLDEILPRRTVLSRPDPNNPRRERLIAANIDVVIHVVSVKKPQIGRASCRERV